MDRATTRKRITRYFAVAGAVVLWAAIIEAALWAWGGVNFKGTDSTLLADRPELGTYGWRPSATGVSFGEDYRFDAAGLRVFGNGENRILLLGDSVAFTVGIPQQRSEAAVLAARTGATVIDASVIGYSLEDHAAAARHLVRSAVPDILVVMLTLNDIQPSAREQILTPAKPAGALMELNMFLRQHSRTYLFLKGLFDRTAARYFEADRRTYAAASPERTGELLARVADDVPTLFLRMPYRHEADTAIDQSIRAFWAGAGFVADVPVHDVSKPLLEALRSEAFLWDDPMHLSEQGARFVGEWIAKRVIDNSETR